MKYLLRVALIFVFGAATIQSYAGKDEKHAKNLDAYFQEALIDWNIPGMAVAIVKDNKVLLSKGYGFKNIDTKERVDDKTLFAIASNSKAFTSAALAMLVDEGKLNWDDKVQKYIPHFQLYDPYVSSEMTIRDLLCHRSGLETFSGDLIWYGSTYSRDDVIRRARYLKSKYGFRSHYGYQNIMFITAGEIIPAVTGMSWDEFVHTRIFDPLGMSTSNTSIERFNKKSNVATPHNEKNGINKPIEWVNWDNIGGAGAINSCVSELTQWMMLQLNEGELNGKKYWEKSQTDEMWSSHTPKGISPWSKTNWPTKTFSSYGLGWDLFNYQGRKIVNHGGGYDGMISHTCLVPEENLGVVILTNNINFLPYAMMYQVMDEFFEVDKSEDWGQMFLGFKKDGEKRDAEAIAKAEEERIKDTKPSLALEEYAGLYGGDMYGTCVVRIIGDQLAFQFEPTPLFRGTFRHWHYDTFQLNWSSKMMLPSGTVQFIVGTDGKVEEMKIDVPNPDFDFTELEFKKIE